MLWKLDPRERLGALTTDAAGEQDVLGHDGDALGVDGAEVGVLEEADEVSLASQGGEGEDDMGAALVGFGVHRAGRARTSDASWSATTADD